MDAHHVIDVGVLLPADLLLARDLRELDAQRIVGLATAHRLHAPRFLPARP